MKVNPIGIQAYQQLNKRENQSGVKVDQSQPSKIEDKNIDIRPQEENQVSRLAVKTNTDNYSKFLSPEERNALDLLFARYQDKGRFGPGYREDLSNNDESVLGRTIDVKV